MQVAPRARWRRLDDDAGIRATAQCPTLLQQIAGGAVCAVVGVVCLLVICAVIAAIRAIPASGETMYPEGWMLYGILRVRDGAALYADYHAAPFIMVQYTPLYSQVVGLAARGGALDLDGVTALARSVTALSALGAACSIYGLGRLCGVTRVGALVAVGLFVASPVLHPWAYTARPDTLALALSLLGVWVGLRSSGWRGAAVAGIILAAAFFTKQSYVAAVATLVLWSVWSRGFSRASVLVGVWVGCVAGGVLLLQVTTDGHFAANTLVSNVLPMQLELTRGQLLAFLHRSLPAIVLAIVGWRWAMPRARRGTVPAIRLYAVVALGLAALLLSKAGSNYNHFFEAVAALCILAGRGVDWLRLAAARPRSVTSATAVTSITAITSAASTASAAGRATGPALVVSALTLAGFLLPGLLLLGHARGVASDAPLLERLRATPGTVLTERDSFVALRAGKHPVAADPLGLSLLA